MSASDGILEFSIDGDISAQEYAGEKKAAKARIVLDLPLVLSLYAYSSESKRHKCCFVLYDRAPRAPK